MQSFVIFPRNMSLAVQIMYCRLLSESQQDDLWFRLWFPLRRFHIYMITSPLPDQAMILCDLHQNFTLTTKTQHGQCTTLSSKCTWFFLSQSRPKLCRVIIASAVKEIMFALRKSDFFALKLNVKEDFIIGLKPKSMNIFKKRNN